jgi:hypothetical protein
MDAHRSPSDQSSVETQIMARMRRAGRGSVWSAAQLHDIAQRNTLDQALVRLAKKQHIRRICHGLYVYPLIQPLIGEVPVTINAIITALNVSEPVPLVPSGAYACYLLGIVRDIPARITLLSHATTRTVSLGTRQIVVRPTAPRYLAGAGRLSGVLIQAWRFLGAEHVTAQHVQTLQQRISHASREMLRHDMQLAPAWMHPWIQLLIEAPPAE